jgi:hypothetical protein
MEQWSMKGYLRKREREREGLGIEAAGRKRKE